MKPRPAATHPQQIGLSPGPEHRAVCSAGSTPGKCCCLPLEQCRRRALPLGWQVLERHFRKQDAAGSQFPAGQEDKAGGRE